MDFSKIINDSIDKSVRDVTSGKFKDELMFDDDKLKEESQQNQFLINYSNTLLETYHEELRKELANHGIHI